MNILSAYAYVTSHGVAFLRACLDVHAYDLAAYGISVRLAKSYKRTAEAFLGAADSPRVQRETLELAESKGLSVEHLVMINRHAGKLKARGKAWALRAELVAMNGSFDEVNEFAAQRVRELSGPTPPQPGVRISRGRDGMRTMSITDDQRAVTDLEKTLDALTAAREEAAGALPRSEALRESFWQHLNSGSAMLKPAYSTVIAVGVEDAVQLMRGEGDDVVLGLSDGTTMTGAEYLRMALAGALGDEILAGLFHPTHGPVNLYGARFASAKQRILAKAENLVCPWPDCAVPADRCQVHHIQAHAHGGQTEPSNLTMLCPYHNGVNDDDPRQRLRGRRTRGRVDRHFGRVRYSTPSGKLIANRHDNCSRGAMDLIASGI